MYWRKPEEKRAMWNRTMATAWLPDYLEAELKSK